MPRDIALGEEFFSDLRNGNSFYIDKTDFIRQWWNSKNKVTAIMRPRRFGKTLNMSMVECFFSVKYAHREDLFDGLSIWEEESFRKLQGTYPVLFLSFARIMETTYEEAKREIKKQIRLLYRANKSLLRSDLLQDYEKAEFADICANPDMSDSAAKSSLLLLMDYLFRYYGKKVIMLLDEYDTPLQEAYARGFWEEMVDFLCPLFTTTFKGNPFLERGLMTGITRVAKESIFSGLNNLEVVTTLSKKYAGCFGFTQEEVSASLEEYGLSDHADDVKKWYDGFTFGTKTDIYNPWSITHYLDKKEPKKYWANNSSNALISELIRKSDYDVKKDFETLLNGESIEKVIVEEIVYAQLEEEDAVWSLLLASGYLKIVPQEEPPDLENPVRLALTNGEVREEFKKMIIGWFRHIKNWSKCRKVIDALLDDNLEKLNSQFNELLKASISYFDPANDPECFYHGFCLGMLANLDGIYKVTSNRESGSGRYDIILEPRDRKRNPAFILEFKIQDKGEKSLEETARRALDQIDKLDYARCLLSDGFTPEQIRKYGFGFKGKDVCILRGTWK